MIRIPKPLTKRISLIFALFVTFSLFIGCGQENEISRTSETEGETRSLVLLAPGIKSDDNLEVSLEPKSKYQEFVITSEDDTFTIFIGENTYFVNVKNISEETVKNVKVNYKVKCILNEDIEKEEDPEFQPKDQCDGQVIISEVDGIADDRVDFNEKKNEVTIYLGDIEKGSNRELKIVVKLNAEKEKPVKENELPPHDVKVRNEVCVYYGLQPW